MIFKSIAATIQFHRPDLPIPVIESANSHDVIPLNPPFNFLSGKRQQIESKYSFEISLEGIPGIGELMLASFPPPNFFNDFEYDSWYFSIFFFFFLKRC